MSAGRMFFQKPRWCSLPLLSAPAPAQYREGEGSKPDRVPQGAFGLLERGEGKLSRPVLRGLGGSNAPRLPGGFSEA